MVKNQNALLDSIFSALSDRTRRDILSRLVETPATIGEISSHYEMSLAAISKHIGILERAGLIGIEKSGRERICSLSVDGFRDAELWLQTIGGAEWLDWEQLEQVMSQFLDSDG